MGPVVIIMDVCGIGYDCRYDLNYTSRLLMCFPSYLIRACTGDITVSYEAVMRFPYDTEQLHEHSKVWHEMWFSPLCW